jgi:hypothetical protein
VGAPNAGSVKNRLTSGLRLIDAAGRRETIGGAWWQKTHQFIVNCGGARARASGADRSGPREGAEAPRHELVLRIIEKIKHRIDRFQAWKI